MTLPPIYSDAIAEAQCVGDVIRVRFRARAADGDATLDVAHLALTEHAALGLLQALKSALAARVQTRGAVVKPFRRRRRKVDPTPST